MHFHTYDAGIILDDSEGKSGPEFNGTEIQASIGLRQVIHIIIYIHVVQIWKMQIVFHNILEYSNCPESESCQILITWIDITF